MFARGSNHTLTRRERKQLVLDVHGEYVLYTGPARRLPTFDLPDVLLVCRVVYFKCADVRESRFLQQQQQ